MPPSHASADPPGATQGGPDDPHRFQATSSSELERLVIRHLCEPLVARIPARVHPNTISLVTHLLVWLSAGLAAVSAHLPVAQRGVALVGAGIGVFLTMVGDNIDGMHARRTQQCSKVGEMMDHWLDAIAVPLTMAGLGLALRMPDSIFAPALVTCAMIYQAQLLLYHHTGQFVHAEPTSGTEAQLGASLIYLVLAALLQFLDPDGALVGAGVITFGILTIFMQMRCSFFYYARLGSLIRYHLPFVAHGSAAGALFVAGALQVHAFTLLIVFMSFRISGSYVLATIVRRRYRGNDWSITVWLLALAGAHYGLAPRPIAGTTLQALLPYVACAHWISRNLGDFVGALPTLVPARAPVQPRSAGG